MTERVEIGNAVLYRGDCCEILPGLEGIDACVTDPPYGIGFDYRKRRGSKSKSWVGWANVIGDDNDFNPHHLLNYRQVILFGANHYSDRLPASAKWIVWDKRPGLPSIDFADCEMAWTNLKGPARIHRQLWNGGGIQSIDFVKGRFERLHPSQKPIELMRFCMAQLDDKTALVCDPYLGSGTTGVAAYESGHRFVGIECDKAYFDVACERIENAQRQERLAL